MRRIIPLLLLKRGMTLARLLGRSALLIVGLFAAAPTFGEEFWVSSIRTSPQWAVFPCKDYGVTNVCGTDKDYTDPGALPLVVSVGDVLTYTDKSGTQKQFVVRHIRFSVFDNDVDITYGGKHLTAKKGETVCTLYDVKDRAASRATEYPSKIMVKNCRTVEQ